MSVAPRLLVADVGLEIHQVGDVVAGDRQAPDPRVVGRRTIEAGRGVFPLCLGQGSTAARCDSLTGIFGSLLVSLGVVVGSSALQICTGLEAIDHCQAGRIGICRRVIGKVCRRLFEVGEDYFFVHLGRRSAGIGFGFRFGRRFRHNGHCQADNSIAGGILVLLEFIDAYQVEVERGPVCVGKAEDMFGRGRESFRVDGADDIVGRLDPCVIVFPGQVADCIVVAEGVIGTPLAEPVVARIARYDDLTGRRVRSEVDGRQREVPVHLVIGRKRPRLYQCGGDTFHHSFEGC